MYGLAHTGFSGYAYAIAGGVSLAIGGVAKATTRFVEWRRNR